MSNLKNIITETINNFLAESASAFRGCEDIARDALFYIKHHWYDEYQGTFSIDVPWGYVQLVLKIVKCTQKC